MGKLKKFLTRISYIAYLSTLKDEVATRSINFAGTIINNKEQIREGGDKIIGDVESLHNSIAADASNISKAQKYTYQTFPSAKSNVQIATLQNAEIIKRSIDKNEKRLSEIHDNYDKWSDNMMHVFVIKKSHISSSSLSRLSEATATSKNDLKNILKNGKTIDNLTYEQAVQMYELFSECGVNCYFGLRKINDNINSIHKNYVDRWALEKAYSKTTLGFRLLASIIWLALFLFVAVCIGNKSEPYLMATIGAVVCFFVLWGIQKLIGFMLIPLTSFVVEKIMMKVEKTYAITLSDIINDETPFYKEQGENILIGISANNAMIVKNRSDLDKYLYEFFPRKLPFSFAIYVADQLKTGCNFSEGCWRAEQVMAQQKWQDEMRKKQEKRDAEERAWREKMLESQKRKEAYERERAEAEQSAAYELRQRNYEIRQNTKETKALREELKRLEYNY